MKRVSAFGGVLFAMTIILLAGSVVTNAQFASKADNGADSLAVVTRNKVTPFAPKPSPSPTPIVKAKMKTVDWTGFYAGLNGGFASGKSLVGTSTSFVTNPNGYFSSDQVPAFNAVGGGVLKQKGFTGGGTLGYNIHSSKYVYGIEADFGLLNLHKSVSATGAIVCCTAYSFTLTQSVKTKWLATARPRAGLAFGGALFYVTGGLAITDINYHESYADNYVDTSNPNNIINYDARESGSIIKTRLGWTGGGGLEFMVHGNWSAKLEYLYANFGVVSGTSNTLTSGGPHPNYPLAVFNHAADLKFGNAKIGINYRF